MLMSSLLMNPLNQHFPLNSSLFSLTSKLASTIRFYICEIFSNLYLKRLATSVSKTCFKNWLKRYQSVVTRSDFALFSIPHRTAPSFQKTRSSSLVSKKVKKHFEVFFKLTTFAFK